MDNRNDGQNDDHSQPDEHAFNHCLKSTERSINSAGIISEKRSIPRRVFNISLPLEGEG